INPNGLIFGPNAALDIDGSFLASTGDRFTFGEGVEFRADEPNEAPMVAVNIPVGLQYGDAPARLISQANLETGENLTLTASSVNSQGTLSAPLGELVIEGNIGDVQVQQLEANTATLHAGQDLQLIESTLETSSDLTLQANGTVLARDSLANPFVAIAGNNLLLQGQESIDILALKHPETTPFQSGNNLTLASNGDVSGDTAFASGGNFSIETLTGNRGTFLSRYDPVITVGGSVTFGDYTGASLKVEAGGSIEGDNIVITNPDCFVCVPEPNSNDGQLLTGSRTLILRAGLDPAPANSNFPENAGGTDFVDGTPLLPPGSISIASVDTRNIPPGESELLSDRGIVILNSQTGDVRVTGGTSVAADQSIIARSVTINAPGVVEVTNSINARNDDLTNEENLPTLQQLAPDGVRIGNDLALIPTAVTFNDISTRNGQNDTDDDGIIENNGGDIFIRTSGILTTTGSFSSGGRDLAIASQGNGNGGNISIIADGGTNITGEILSSSALVDNGDVAIGSGGDIIISSTNGTTRLGSVSSFSIGDANEGGNVNGGFIFISNRDGEISTRDISSTSEEGSASFVYLSSRGDIDVLGAINADSQSFVAGIGGNQLNGGGIFLMSQEGSVSTQDLSAITNSEEEGTDSGRVRIRANETITTGDITTSSNGGNSGTIDLLSENSTILTGDLDSKSQQGSAGNITLNTLGISGAVTTGIITSSTQGEEPTSFDMPGDVSGSVDIDSTGQVATGAISTASNAGTSGNINLRSRDAGIRVGFGFGTIQSTSATGLSGDITLQAGNTDNLDADGLTFDAVQTITVGDLDSRTGGVGLDSGAITLQTERGAIFTGRISTENTSQDSTGDETFFTDAGDIELNAFGNITTGDTITSESIEGQSGDIDLISRGGEIEIGGGNGSISSRVTRGEAQNITIQANQRVAVGSINSQIITDVPVLGLTSNAGNISVISEENEITVSGAISSSTLSGDTNSLGGDVTLSAFEKVTTSSITSTSSAGSSGDITVISLASGVNTSLGTLQSNTQEGEAGEINIEAQGDISTASVESLSLSGNSGLIEINSGTGGIDTSAGTISSETSDGRANSITLGAAEDIVTSDVSSSSSGLNNAGQVTIEAGQDFLIENSSIESEAEASGTSDGVRIVARNITLNNAAISATTNSGVAGEVTITAADSIRLNGAVPDEERGGILARATGDGSAGNVRIIANQLTVENGASIAVDTDGAETSNIAGDISIDATSVTLNSNGQIRANTNAGGNNDPINDPANINFSDRLNTLVVNDGEISYKVFSRQF
ncbi:MAG: hypothetical protein F6K16_38940, partial [Symploca sp. SIO2B6]|nr:hypothetical protein [Symploca sp. SIO2B6]